MPRSSLAQAARWTTLLLPLAIATPSAAQRWSWPEHAKNLRVLPEDTGADELRSVMQGFSHALGVRCAHCHATAEGQSFADIDFSSDQNPNKGRARKMMEMLGSIRKHLSDFESSAPEPASVSCYTCHRGTARPVPLADLLWHAYHADGAQAAVDEYHSLRARYYGRGSYDFGEGALNETGYRALEAGDAAAAVTLLTLNTELFPASGNAWDSLAEAYLAQGDREKAIELYRKALELDPDNRDAAKKLGDLGAVPGDDKADE